MDHLLNAYHGGMFLLHTMASLSPPKGPDGENYSDPWHVEAFRGQQQAGLSNQDQAEKGLQHPGDPRWRGYLTGSFPLEQG